MQHLRPRLRDDFPVPRHRHHDLRMVEPAETALQAHVQQVAGGPLLGIELQQGAELVADPFRLADLQPDVAEDAGRDEARQDVPADHMRRLAEGLEFGRRSRIANRRNVVVLRFDDGRTEEDGKLVLPFFHMLRHVELMGNEHVGGLADPASVQKDVAERVKSVERQRRLLVLRDRPQIERLRIEPLVAFIRTHRVLVVRIEEVGQLPRRAEVELIAARDLRGHGHRLRRDLLQSPHAPLIGGWPSLQLPITIQRQQRRRKQHQCVHSQTPD